MNREIWEQIINFIPITDYPLLPCPYCKNESLEINEETISYRKATCNKTQKLIQNKIEKKVESVGSIANQHIGWGILLGALAALTHEHRVPAKFIVFLSCSNCNGHVSATGTAQYSEDLSNQKNMKSQLIKVEYFSPPLPIFNLSSNVPSNIHQEVLQSFNHFHSDLSSSGAKLRRSIEKMCLELGFKEKNLHATISSMQKDFPTEAELLHSLKLIGNEATHKDSVNEEDLLDAFEVQDFVLGLFDRIKAKKEVEETSKRLMQKFEKKSDKPIP